jgi:hypothetical protein
MSRSIRSLVGGSILQSRKRLLAEAHCVYPGVLLQEMIVPLMAETEMQANGAEQHPSNRSWSSSVSI